MSSRLFPYVVSTAARSTLFRNPPEAVPPTDELEALHVELKALRQKTLERAKKAGEDLKVIEESMRQLKEREKGKGRAVDKVKRERGFTPLPDSDERTFPTPINGVLSKARPSSIPLSSLPPSARSAVDPPRRLTAEELKKKKKKRKRDEDSDLEIESLYEPKAPPITHTPSLPPRPPKTLPPALSSHQKSGSGPDFAVPPPMSLLPQRPPVPPPPIPGPSKPLEVMEDFSKAKQPSQVLVSTFYTSIEPWIRGVKEEDIGFLEFTADEVEPYVTPKLGKHYLQAWEAEDAGLGESSSSAQLPKWEPSNLSEPDLLTEERSHGPLTERLISALLPMHDMTVWKGVKAAEDAMEGRPGGSGAAAARREKMNIADLEERIQDTMRFHGLLSGIPDYSERVDDAIATALRHAQRELRTVVATNKARKERLAAIARDRLGYQEYLDLRESIDKSITALYTKLQKKDSPKHSKKRKKAGEANGNGNGNGGNGTGGVLAPSPAALGLGPDDENRLVISDQLKQLVEMRRKWVDTVGSVFDEKEREMSGRIWGLPKQSIYGGIEEEIRRNLQRIAPLTRDSSADQRTQVGGSSVRRDEMDVG